MTDQQCQQSGRDASKYPGFTGVGYPEVFTIMPPQPTEKKVGQLPQENVEEFFRQVKYHFSASYYVNMPDRILTYADIES